MKRSDASTIAERSLTERDEEDIREMLPATRALVDRDGPSWVRFWLTSCDRLLTALEAERAAHAKTREERQRLLDAVLERNDQNPEHAIADAVKRVGVLYEVDADRASPTGAGLAMLRVSLKSAERDSDAARAQLAALRAAAEAVVSAKLRSAAEEQAIERLEEILRRPT